MSQLTRPAGLLTAIFATAIVAQSATAADLSVSSIEVNQAVQYGSTKLFANNVTWVRVKVGISGSSTAVPGVDAALRISVNGFQLPGPPIFSLNGPITAPLAPNSANINDTINFAMLPPISGNVGFTVEVNPNRNVVETSYANNTLTVSKAFECRKTVEIAYVPINYTFNGAGLPPANLIEPGIGDGFLRGIYKTWEWNYHISPTPPLTWSSDINSSNNTLLNTLRDIRLNQIPATPPGYSTPEFVYGWLPGNPYSGNGQTISIPGDVAFGNTDTTRHQRTFAHEMGHALGRAHINQTINTIGVDVERHLKDTQNIPQLMPTTKNDIMVAGLLTNQAWIWQATYDAVHNDSRLQCPPSMPEFVEPVLRISGVIENATREVQLDAVTRIARGELTRNDPAGDTTIVALNAHNVELWRVTVRTDSSRELCAEHINGRSQLDPRSPLYVILPETVEGQNVHAFQVIDRATGRVTASRTRSASPPQVQFAEIGIAINRDLQPGAQRDESNRPILDGRIRISWTAADADGDALSSNLLYSPDNGRSWLPLAVNLSTNSFEFDANTVPASTGSAGRFKLVTSDGFNVVEAQSQEYAFLPNNAPFTYLLTPNNADSFPQWAPIAFHAASWDLEDKMLTGGQIVWNSSIDGTIGIGQLFMKSNLSPGTHTIIVTGIDTSGLSSSRQITLTITPRTVISPDCNNNGVLDSTDISNGTSADVNGNGVPDECETLCAADIVPNGYVNIDDLFAVINAWGNCPTPCPANPPSCPADVVQNCTVNIDDLFAVIGAWGPCP